MLLGSAWDDELESSATRVTAHPFAGYMRSSNADLSEPSWAIAQLGSDKSASIRVIARRRVSHRRHIDCSP